MFAFKKSQRLIHKAEYDHVFAQAQKKVTNEFILLFRENDLGHARLGLALSKKMIAKAHDRNRIKRILRESFRQSALPAVDMIFLARQGLAAKSNQMLRTQLCKIWDALPSV